MSATKNPQLAASEAKCRAALATHKKAFDECLQATHRWFDKNYKTGLERAKELEAAEAAWLKSYNELNAVLAECCELEKALGGN